MSGNILKIYEKGRFRREKEVRKKREFEAKVAKLNGKNFKSESKKWDRNVKIPAKDTLLELYSRKNKSMKDIGKILGCSTTKTAYWMQKYGISRRTISEAIYEKQNPLGDPFELFEPKNISNSLLMGMGLGLYWGEGTKADRNSIRLGNTDPALIRTFLSFLDLFGVKKNKLRFGLQIFSDTKPLEALDFWLKNLDAGKSQFQKVVITPSRGKGTYRNKSKYGVLTVYFNNKRLRNVIVGKLKDYGYSGE